MPSPREATDRGPTWWVRLYCYVTIIAVVYGLGAAHVPFLLGDSWSTCQTYSSTLSCVLTLHLFEAPLTLFNIFVAWYGLKRFSAAKLGQFMSLLVFSVALNITFFLFECELVLSQLQRQAPNWEVVVTTSLAFMMLGGTGLAIFVRQKLGTYVDA